MAETGAVLVTAPQPLSEPELPPMPTLEPIPTDSPRSNTMSGISQILNMSVSVSGNTDENLAQAVINLTLSPEAYNANTGVGQILGPLPTTAEYDTPMAADPPNLPPLPKYNNVPGLRPIDLVQKFLRKHTAWNSDTAVITDWKPMIQLGGIRCDIEKELQKNSRVMSVNMECLDRLMVLVDPETMIASVVITGECRDYLRDYSLPQGPLPRPLLRPDLMVKPDTTGIWFPPHKGILEIEANADSTAYKRMCKAREMKEQSSGHT